MTKFLLSTSLWLSCFTSAFAQINEPLGDPGVRPQAEDGRVLNLDFETGDLTDWTATGTAWQQQPVQGEINRTRPGGKEWKSQHTGDYWLGGYEKLRDAPKGTLTSVPFKVTHNWCSFLVGGGSHPETRVELVRNSNKQVFYRISGQNREEMQPTVVNLASYVGEDIFIRIVDEHSGGWGHLNFDDFRFSDRRARFRLPVLTPPPQIQLGDLYPFEDLSGEEAAAKMIVPDGFKVQLAAQEPNVKQPIAMAIDDRGRVWVAEAYEYPFRAKEGEGRDRILILEDTDLDGTLDSRKVFIEGLNLVSGMEIGFGGVWVGAAPYLMFIPDQNGNDIPDGLEEDKTSRAREEAVNQHIQFPKDIPPGATALLDGFGYEDTHETLNAFIWGPDGWLYGCHGVFTHSRVGKPGTPDEERIGLNAGVWRYHPTRNVFEVYAHGTSNPWGVDFNEYGDAFVTACVIPHLYHIIPGARYQRQGGQHFNPFTYDDIKTIAKHRHFVGNQWNDNDRARSDDMGGGHAHAGAMFYLGGREGHAAPEWEILQKYADKPGWHIPEDTTKQGWPEEFHGKLFMNNIHGNRINVDQLIPQGSGYVGERYPDLLLTRDKWSQMIYMTYGPDGQMYCIDWYDQNQCHRREEGAHDRSNGRVFRVSYGNSQPVKVNLKDMSTKDLYQLAIVSENEWYVRHASRIIQERSERDAEKVDAEITEQFVEEQRGNESQRGIRRGFRVAKFYSEAFFEYWVATELELQNESEDSILSYLNQIQGEPFEDQSHVKDLAALLEACNRTYDSQRMRLKISSILQSLPSNYRWNLLEYLTSHPEDAKDHNLPLMYWYAMEPLADVNPQRALALAMSAGENIPLLREFMVRRLGSGKPEESLKLLVDGLANAKDDAIRLTFLKGIRGAIAGREGVTPPEAWNAVYHQLSKPNSTAQDFDVYLYTLGIGARFGDSSAQQKLADMVIDESGPYEERKVAFGFLVENDYHELPQVIGELLTGTTLRAEALRAAATVNNPEIAKSIIASYKSLNANEQTDARNTLASRANYAVELLTATESGAIPKQDLSADLIRQLRNLEDPQVMELLQRVWGVVRESDVDRQALIAHYTQLVTNHGQAPDAGLGRALFAKTCQQCHTLFGTGGKVGPDITGANRADLNYLLSNVLDPSSVMAKEYQPSILATDTGRVITGIVKEETDTLLSIQTANEIVTVPINEIEARKQSEQSMMPDDLLKTLTDHEARSLVAYLQGVNQVPMAATSDNLNRFYSGTDLTGWRATREEDQPLWSVENGELIGRSSGLKHNAFLVSEMKLGDFIFSCDVKLVDNVGNSGIQFRSQPLEDGEMRGYQADVGAGWWGKLYEERGRALLVDQDNSKHVKHGDWNHYEIRAIGPRVQTFLNGQQVVDLNDPNGARSGQLAFQLHSGGATEVRYRNLKLQLADALPEFVKAGAPADSWPKSVGETAQNGITWEKIRLDDVFRSEGCAIVDLNNDGLADVAAGSVWYEQGPKSALHIPSFTQRSITALPEEFDPKGYSNTFCNFPLDVNSDGWVDLVIVDFPGKPTWWFENPGTGDRKVPWKKHEITPVTNNESPQFLDITGDGQRELLCGFDQKVMGFASPKDLPNAQWRISAVSAPGAPGTDRFSHGIGSGDVNGDGRNDILITKGWWEAPEDYSTEQPWEWHATSFGEECSQMYVYDFDGDGDNDVLSASAHRFGIWWHENQGQSSEGSELQWKTHVIDESFSQTHALVLADINGDGLPDFVTGKRYWAHGGKDPGGDQPPVVYWFELKREGGKPVWKKHQIDDNSGVGTQFDVADVNGDGLLDIATSNKKGTFLFLQQRKPIEVQ